MIETIHQTNLSPVWEHFEILTGDLNYILFQKKQFNKNCHVYIKWQKALKSRLFTGSYHKPYSCYSPCISETFNAPCLKCRSFTFFCHFDCTTYLQIFKYYIFLRTTPHLHLSFLPPSPLSLSCKPTLWIEHIRRQRQTTLRRTLYRLSLPGQPQISLRGLPL
jgi:hypothetical protein